MIMVGFDFVIVLLALDMDEVQLINKATALQHVDRAIDRRAIDTRIFVFWQARAGLPRRNAGANPGYADDQAPLFRSAYAACCQLQGTYCDFGFASTEP